LSKERRSYTSWHINGERVPPWLRAVMLVALTLASLAFASGDGNVAQSVPFRIALNLDPTPEWDILGGRDEFTPPGAHVVLRTLLERVAIYRHSVEEPFVPPLQENLPAVWLPLRAWRPVAAGAGDISGAELLIRSPRLRLVPTPGHEYGVLLQYLGPGEMAEPLRVASDPPTEDGHRFPVLIISFSDLLSEGGELPPVVVLAGELVWDDGCLAWQFAREHLGRSALPGLVGVVERVVSHASRTGHVGREHHGSREQGTGNRGAHEAQEQADP